MSESITDVMEPVPGGPPKTPKGDLGVRTLSAIIMVAVAGGALSLGGIWFDLFVTLVGLVCVFEFIGLIRRIPMNSVARFFSIAIGLLYIGGAIYLVTRINSLSLLLLLFGSIICVDVFAYFFGRTFGGPKIAPRISPSKTWAGLIGGVVGATVALILYFSFGMEFYASGTASLPNDWYILLIPGFIVAVLAQTGDFFESWLKRKAGVKDSSRLIPGHGGVFDRIDGMLPVAILYGLWLVAFFPHWLNR